MLKELEKDIEILSNLIDFESKRERIAELEASVSWSDVKLLQELNELNNELAVWGELNTTYEMLKEFAEEGLLEEVENDLKAAYKQMKQFKQSFMFNGKYDKNNVILSIHAGAGGKEAQDWPTMLLRMYTRWAEDKGFEVNLLDSLAGDDNRLYKSATLKINGKNAYGLLKNETGVHRLVRVSPFDANGRRHTSFAAVEVMPEIEIDKEVSIRNEDLRVDYFRASGAGGQHINTTDSAVRITHLPTGIVVSCQNERSQHQNKDYAMKMLISKLIHIKEQEHLNEITEIKGEQRQIQWGSQIRSYVFMPYQLVKDHRTNAEIGDIEGVLDGDLDAFIIV
jgi:peptide chain release factor 2